MTYVFSGNRTISVLFGVVFLFSAFFPFLYKQFNHIPMSVKHSPDKCFRIEYYAILFLPLRPHYASGMGCTDCSGYVRLLRNSDGEILQEKYFSTRHEVSSGVNWSDNEVSMKLFASWPLPKDCHVN